MERMIFMNIQGFQKLTLLDFPGKVACTVFTGGCNLKCPFCHNAGLVVSPNEYPSAESDVLEYLPTRTNILDGVCLTGGEPLLQKDILDFIKKIKALGYKVKLDTNGASPNKLKEVLDSGLVDYVAMDVKASKENYSRACGCNVDVAKIEESIKIIRSSHVDHEFRTTAVKGIHSIDEFESIAHWLGSESKYFIQKFVDSGNLLGTDCSAFSYDEMDQIIQTVKKIIPEATLRGQE